MNLRKLFLPVGLVLGMAVGLSIPAPGAALFGIDWGLVSPKSLCVVLVFLVMGYEIDPRSVRFGRAFVRALAAAIVVNLLLAPLIAAGIMRVLPLSVGVAMGLGVMASVPTTLSSSAVITQAAGGNRPWAVSMIVLLNTLGVFVLPFTLSFVLGSGGVEINEWAILVKILQKVVGPLLIGAAVREFIGHRPIAGLGYLPSTCVVLMAWMAISDSQASILALTFGRLSLLLAACALHHGTLLVLAWGAGRGLRLEWPDFLALVFVAAQKTLPIALTVLLIVANGGEEFRALIGPATVVCVIYHFLQINGDSMLAAMVGPREKHEAKNG